MEDSKRLTFDGPDYQPCQGRLNWDPGFDPVKYWSKFEYPKWVVYLTGKKIGRKRGRNIYDSATMIVQARNEERAVACAKRHSLVKGRVSGFALLARPSDLGCVSARKKEAP
jgi:hypothetical protein